MAAEALDGEALRRAAAGAAGDARVAAMLSTATVTAVADGPRWEASHGAMQGYAVTVALDAEDLAAVDASPPLRDLLERAFARAFADSPGCAMTALDARWSRRHAVPVGTYRAAAPASVGVALGEALRRYLAVREAGGRWDVRAEEDADGVTVTADAPLDRGQRETIERALGAMLGATPRVRWRAP